MSHLRVHITTLALIFALVVVGIFGVEYWLRGVAHGSLLFTLVVWTGIVEGCVALVAMGDVVGAKWPNPVRRFLLAVYPLILVLALLFAALTLQVHNLPWAGKAHGTWFHPKIFMLRNFVLLAIVFFTAWKFAKESIRMTDRRSKWAVIYLLLYVANQSFVAFDWVMALDYPWPSALLGGLFFIEGVYVALAIAGLIGLGVYRKSKADFLRGQKGYRDLGGFRFAFSFGWGWFFFAQYLIIWYGNLPEETEWFTHRLHHQPYAALFWVVFALIFVIPFVTQLPERSKKDPRFFSIISVVMLTGFLLERILMIVPRVALHPVAVAEFVGLLLLFLLAIANREKVFGMPEEWMAELEAAPGSSGH